MNLLVFSKGVTRPGVLLRRGTPFGWLLTIFMTFTASWYAPWQLIYITKQTHSRIDNEGFSKWKNQHRAHCTGLPGNNVWPRVNENTHTLDTLTADAIWWFLDQSWQSQYKVIFPVVQFISGKATALRIPIYELVFIFVNFQYYFWEKLKSVKPKLPVFFVVASREIWKFLGSECQGRTTAKEMKAGEERSSSLVFEILQK